MDRSSTSKRSKCVHCGASLLVGRHSPNCPSFEEHKRTADDGVVSTDEHTCGCGHDIKQHRIYENVMFCHGPHKELGVCGCRKWNPNDDFSWLPASLMVLARGSMPQKVDLVRGVSAILRYLDNFLPPDLQWLVDVLETFDGTIVKVEKAEVIDQRESIIKWLQSRREWLAMMPPPTDVDREMKEVVYILNQIANAADMTAPFGANKPSLTEGFREVTRAFLGTTESWSEELRSAMRKCANRLPGESVTLTDREIFEILSFYERSGGNYGS